MLSFQDYFVLLPAKLRKIESRTKEISSFLA